MKRQVLRFVGHYVQMVLAMLVGMVVLALPWMVIWPGLSDQPVPDTLVIAVNMTIGMAAWMAIRRHPLRMVGEMSLAMLSPFVVLLPPLAAGAITVETLMAAGHVLMFLTMLSAMLLRRDHYTHRNGSGPVRHSAPTGEGNVYDNEGMKVHESINHAGR